MQGVVLQTWCRKNSTHPLPCVVASKRRGTTTDCDHPELAPDVGTKAGIPEDTMWRLLGMFGLAKGEGRAKQALNMTGRQAKAWGHGYVTFARPILNDVHSSHALSTKLCSDCVGCHFVTLAVLRQRSACKTANATFSIARASSESHVCFADNSRLSFFPWSGLERQEACSSLVLGVTCVNWTRWFSLFCTVYRGKSTDCGFILCRISICW